MLVQKVDGSQCSLAHRVVVASAPSLPAGSRGDRAVPSLCGAPLSKWASSGGRHVQGRVKVAVVGCGVVATAYYLPYLLSLPTADLVALCDLDERRTAACARLFGVRKTYSDYDRMIDDAGADAVLILTAPDTHPRFAIRAAAAGLHLLIQKPMATTMADAQAIAGAVRAAGVKCLVEPSSTSPLVPTYIEIRDAIKRGVIGEPYTFFYRPSVPERSGAGLLGGNPYGAGAFYTKSSGGMLFDYPYAQSEVAAVLGGCRSVIARGAISQPDRRIVPPEDYTSFLESLSDPGQANYWRVVGERERSLAVKQEAEDHFHALYEMVDGAVGSLWVGRAFLPVPPGLRFGGFVVFGTEGNLILGLGGHQASFISSRRGALSMVDADGWEHWPATPQRRRADYPKPAPGASSYYQASTFHLLDCIVNDLEPRVGLEWGLHITEMMVGAKVSADTGRRYELQTTLAW